MAKGILSKLAKATSMFALILGVTIGQLANATDYYVASNGSDGRSGRSPDQAWRTLGRANSELQAGDTVFIDGGTYAEDIAPARSGSGPNARITYRATVPGTVTITGELTLDDRSYVTVSGINIEANRAYVRMRRSQHITIEDSVMWGVNSNPGLHMGSASYGILRRNHITGTNERYLDLIEINGNAHHNLVEDNYLDQASHALILIEGDNNFDDGDPRYNIFRGNVYTNDYHHCVNVQYGSHSNIFERESFLRCGTGDVNPVRSLPNYEHGSEGEAFHAWQPWAIYRFNLIMRSGSKGLDQDHHASMGAMSTRQSTGRLQRVVGIHAYHNTFVDNYGLVFRLGAWCQQGNCDGVKYGDNKFKNNLFYDNASGTTKYGPVAIRYDFFDSPIFSGDVWSGNLIEAQAGDVIMWQGTKYNLDEAAAAIDSNDANFSANRHGEPRFKNASNLNFQLSQGSAAIDIGVPLTRTVGSGSGRRITVEDAGYFLDGFGIIGGDQIQVNGNIVRITNVDYSADAITIDRDVSWGQGDPVSFPFTGQAPDAGAHEFAVRRPVAPILSVNRP